MKTRTKLSNETPKFYEMDGALRAYSNRSMVLAGVMGLVALIAVAGRELHGTSSVTKAVEMDAFDNPTSLDI